MPGPSYAAIVVAPKGADDQDQIQEAVNELSGPTHVGGGWFELSDGTRVQGRDEAVAAEAAL